MKGEQSKSGFRVTLRTGEDTGPLFEGVRLCSLANSPIILAILKLLREEQHGGKVFLRINGRSFEAQSSKDGCVRSGNGDGTGDGSWESGSSQ